STESYEHLPEFEIYLGRKTPTGKLVFQKLCFHQSGKSSPCSPLRNVMRLDLSPNGKRILITYSARVTPQNWKNQAFVKMARGVGTRFDTYILGMYEIETGEMRLAFNYIGTVIYARWLSDSKRYAVVGPSPFGTSDADAE